MPSALPNIVVPSGGLLAVETDRECVPSALKDSLIGTNIRVGDRIAVFGRWIADSGHWVSPIYDGTSSYRAEVHPPLLMAVGGSRVSASAEVVTRILVTSRPYLVMQVFTTDTDTIADDFAGNDGALLEHLVRELDKLRSVGSLTIEAHPKIAAKPFDGIHAFRFNVGPPPLPPHTLGGVQAQVSFQLTHRSGVGVQVIGNPDHVDVEIVLNSAGYVPPGLPPRQEYSVPREQLGDASKLVTVEQIVELAHLLINPVGVANVEQALARGITTDRYQVPDVDLLDRTHALPFVPINHVPPGRGIVVDDNQPYPVFGFIEVRWHRIDVVFGDQEPTPGASDRKV